MTFLQKALQLKPGAFHENVHRLNSLFHDAIIRNDVAATRVITEHADHMPTWCRPRGLENVPFLESLFGATRMVKAHDVMVSEKGAPMANCVGPNHHLGVGSRRKIRIPGGLSGGDGLSDGDGLSGGDGTLGIGSRQTIRATSRATVPATVPASPKRFVGTSKKGRIGKNTPGTPR